MLEDFYAFAEGLRDKFRLAADAGLQAAAAGALQGAVPGTAAIRNAALTATTIQCCNLAVLASKQFPDWRVRLAALDGRGWPIEDVELLRAAGNMGATLSSDPLAAQSALTEFLAAFLAVATARALAEFARRASAAREDDDGE